MCGRFCLTTPEPQLLERFGVKPVEGYKVRYNIAPTQKVPVIFDSSPKKMSMCKWGLGDSTLINARAETLEEKPAFQNANRCLVLADGFFEWKSAGTRKVPFRISLLDEGPFAFAGLWNNYTMDGEQMRSFSIITVPANGQVSQIHDRMPVILEREQERIWLREGDIPDILLRAYEDELKIYPVSPLVNSATADLPAVVKPLVTLGDF